MGNLNFCIAIFLEFSSFPTWRGHQSGEPEITELDDAELRDEDVLGLDVAVDDLKVSFFSRFTSAFLPFLLLSPKLKSLLTYFVLSDGLVSCRLRVHVLIPTMPLHAQICTTGSVRIRRVHSTFAFISVHVCEVRDHSHV